MPRLLLILIVALIAAPALTGCGGGAAPAAFDPNAPATGPLVALGECTGPPGEPIDREVPGIVLPPGAVIVDVFEQDPLTQVTAYVDLTPVNIRLWYEGEDAGIDVLTSEDEIHEVELLVSNGTHRTYAKGGAVCQEGTLLNLVVAEEIGASEFPVPSGAFQGGG